MTSDAKIGLLLGLVFIFIIAFVINGLPRFNPNAMDSNNTNAIQNIVQSDPIGIRERNAGLQEESIVHEDTVNPPPNEDDGTEYAVNNNPWPNNESVEQNSHADEYSATHYYNQESDPTTDYSSLSAEEQEQDSAVASENQNRDDIRYVGQFPFVSNDGSITTLDNPQEQRRVPPAGQGFPFGQNRQNYPGRQGSFFPQGQQVRPAVPTGQGQQAQNNPPVRQRQNEQSGQSTQTNETNKQRTYVVQEGDNNLSKIAKKMYGEQEGNRWVNVNRIYEANKNILKSKDKIFVGQTLIIPQPAPAVEPQPSDILRGGMFQTVSSAGGGAAARENTARMQDTDRWYVVKDDDSLWKIAAEQLGKGTRFEEIKTLNSDILTNENKLKVGTKLRLPAQ
ncbi:MAG: LysM peptidoglycan-binding domain-containing protein [Sedimentisphaerales bacterium]|nr:LysM peptidoglycan-binding domain-containing protein [Sedimentisphaerales bacterium]